MGRHDLFPMLVEYVLNVPVQVREGLMGYNKNINSLLTERAKPFKVLFIQAITPKNAIMESKRAIRSHP